MARANLAISKELQDFFLAAQEDASTIRIVKVVISGEELVLSPSAPSAEYSGTNQHDFDVVLTSLLSLREAALFLFCLSTPTTVGKKWMLLSWVPDLCPVRDKMLYSSSREDLKRYLGLGYFSNEYSANEISDVTWAAYQTSTAKDVDKEHVFTETERLVAEENKKMHKESAANSGSGMRDVPFPVGEGVVEEFARLSSGECNWVELSILNETIVLVASKVVDDHAALQPHVSADQGRFILIRLPSAAGVPTLVFVYSCPESLAPRHRMILSTAKPAVIGAAFNNGIKFEKTLEITAPDEISKVSHALGYSETGSGAASSSSAEITHSRPTRPGRPATKKSPAKFEASADDY